MEYLRSKEQIFKFKDLEILISVIERDLRINSQVRIKLLDLNRSQQIIGKEIMKWLNVYTNYDIN